MYNIIEDKIQKLFSDEKIMKEFLEQKNIDNAKMFLENHGIETSTEELKQVAKLLNEYAKKGNNISEENLDKIVGGKLSWSEARNKKRKYTNRALVNFFLKALPLGIASGITGSIRTNDASGNSIFIGTSTATRILAIKNVICGIKDLHNSY